VNEREREAPQKNIQRYHERVLFALEASVEALVF
jgi:hypothetical protein